MAAARAMYGAGGEKDKQGLAMLGFTEAMQEKALASDVIEIWPENWKAVMVFKDMETQWNVGMGGPIGLRYESLPIVLKINGICKSERASIFHQIKSLEGYALEAMNG